EVEGKNAILFDDMIDTAGTICQSAEALKANGARKILAGCTHAVLSGPALQRLNDAPIDEIIVTDTIPLNGRDKVCKKIVLLSVAPLLGEAIKRIHEEASISSLFV
ncbi:MAG: ribose-phosphate diphosphokinase, partial [Nitrospirota bacterium]